MSAKRLDHKRCLEVAQKYADKKSDCQKVKVGAMLFHTGTFSPVTYGCNNSVSQYGDCFEKGCLRVEKYGDMCKTHRNPDDCRALHAEINAISKIANSKHNADNCVLYITRYPCENCARAIVSAKIPLVVYGRKQEISPMTRDIFERGGVGIIHFDEFSPEDTEI